VFDDERPRRSPSNRDEWHIDRAGKGVWRGHDNAPVHVSEGHAGPPRPARRREARSVGLVRRRPARAV